MAYTAVRANAQYAYADIPSPIGQPLAFFALVRPKNDANDQGILFYGDKDHVSSRYLLQFQGNSAGDPLRYILQNTGGMTVALAFNPGYVNNVWTFLQARSLNATSHKFFKDSLTPQTSSSSISPANIDRFELFRQGGTNNNYMDGDIAYAGLATALTDAQAAELTAGRHPRRVFSPSELVNLWTFQYSGDLTDEVDGITLTLAGSSGTPTWQANPVRIWTGNTASVIAGTAHTIEGIGFNDTQGSGEVYLSDNATFGAGTLVQQTIEGDWLDDAIEIRYDLGALSPGSLYLFVESDGGEVSQAFPVDVAEPADIAAELESVSRIGGVLSRLEVAPGYATVGNIIYRDVHTTPRDFTTTYRDMPLGGPKG